MRHGHVLNQTTHLIRIGRRADASKYTGAFKNFCEWVRDNLREPCRQPATGWAWRDYKLFNDYGHLTPVFDSRRFCRRKSGPLVWAWYCSPREAYICPPHPMRVPQSVFSSFPRIEKAQEDKYGVANIRVMGDWVECWGQEPTVAWDALWMACLETHRPTGVVPLETHALIWEDLTRCRSDLPGAWHLPFNQWMPGMASNKSKSCMRIWPPIEALCGSHVFLGGVRLFTKATAHQIKGRCGICFPLPGDSLAADIRSIAIPGENSSHMQWGEP